MAFDLTGPVLLKHKKLDWTRQGLTATFPVSQRPLSEAWLLHLSSAIQCSLSRLLPLSQATGPLHSLHFPQNLPSPGDPAIVLWTPAGAEQAGFFLTLSCMITELSLSSKWAMCALGQAQVSSSLPSALTVDSRTTLLCCCGLSSSSHTWPIATVNKYLQNE